MINLLFLCESQANNMTNGIHMYIQTIALEIHLLYMSHKYMDPVNNQV